MSIKLEPIYSWIEQHDKFCLKDLLGLLPKTELKNIDTLMTLKRDLYKDRRFFHHRGCFHRKDLFFSGASFYIQPTPGEWDTERLIPGHRWIPFVNPELKPWEVTLLDPWGKAIESEVFPLDMESVKTFHLLHGEESLFTDCQMKADLFGRFFAEFPHYDLEPVMPLIHDIKTDMLRCRVVNYQKGIIQIEAVETPEGNLNWHAALEEGLNRVFEEFELGLTISEQIEWAFFLGARELCINPGSSVAHSIQRNPRLAFYRVGLNTLLWKSDGSIQTILSEKINGGNAKFFLEEGRAFQEQVEGLFNNLNPFTANTLNDVKDLVLSYARDYKRCMDKIAQGSIKPLGKEMQILLTISQYSKCLYVYMDGLTKNPPSAEENQRVVELILETEGLLQSVEPYLESCSL